MRQKSWWRMGGALGLGACLSWGCVAGAGNGLTVRPTGATGSTKPAASTGPNAKASTTPATQLAGLHLQVLAPAALLSSGASVIQATDSAALAAERGVNIVASGGGNIVASGGGNIVASGGGNIVASGGGNIVAGGAGNYRLQASLAKFAPVAKALVTLETLSGALVTKVAVETTANGTVVFPEQHGKEPLLLVTRFKVNGVTYQMSCPIGTDKLMDGAAYAIDPINTVLQGRIRTILNQAGTGLLISPDELKAVWAVFNDADVEVGLDTLKATSTLADLDAFYNQMLAKVPTDKRAVVAAYMGKLRTFAACQGADKPATCPASPAADAKASGEVAASGTR
jgi:hypothetical protein